MENLVPDIYVIYRKYSPSHTLDFIPSWHALDVYYDLSNALVMLEKRKTDYTEHIHVLKKMIPIDIDLDSSLKKKDQRILTL